MSELVKTTLDHDSTDLLIDRWLEHRNGGHDAYYEWFRDVRERKHWAHAQQSQLMQMQQMQKEKEGFGGEGWKMNGNGNLNEKQTNGKQANANGNVNGKQNIGAKNANTQMKQLVAWNKGEFAPENVFCRTVDTGRLIPLDRTWTTHVYHHHSMKERKLSMMPVVFTMLPELMLLRGMHDTGCDEIFIIVTDLKRQEMDDVTEYFKLACRYTFGQTCKPSMERRIQCEHMRLSHTLLRQHRTPCFPQIDLTLRAILYEKNPRFFILFSHQTTSYSQIFFTHPSYVPDEDIFYDYPTGCPNPCCTDECEMIRFPRRGVESASILNVKIAEKDKERVKKKGGRWHARRRNRVKRREMCNWIDCDVSFGRERNAQSGSGSSDGSLDHDHDQSEVESSEGSSEGGGGGGGRGKVMGALCSKCKLVKYCSPEHQRKDWEEHKRVCVKN